MSVGFPEVRPRRTRRTEALRRTVRETRLEAAQLVLPVFVAAGANVRRPIASLPGHEQVSVDLLSPILGAAESAGIGGVIFFGVPDPSLKTVDGAVAADPNGPVPKALDLAAEIAPGLVRWADVCLCQYTSHGHCGPLTTRKEGGVEVDNDAALVQLARAASTYADAGADIVAPSDMMDGRVLRIRRALDAAGHSDVAICSYAAKFASAFYGPFREAAGSTPIEGDRRSHQLDPGNRREARREIDLDVAEGADMIMVKPAGPYLDIVADAAARLTVPVIAYQVSGEYAALVAASERGWLEFDDAITESLLGIRRAGADVIITYAALWAAESVRNR